jgi:hypothetical protein
MTATARPTHALRSRGGKYKPMVAVCGAVVGGRAMVVGFPEYNQPTPTEPTCERCRVRIEAGADYLRGPADLRVLGE